MTGRVSIRFHSRGGVTVWIAARGDWSPRAVVAAAHRVAVKNLSRACFGLPPLAHGVEVVAGRNWNAAVEALGEVLVSGASCDSPATYRQRISWPGRSGP
jgi:hypothetical protein